MYALSFPKQISKFGSYMKIVYIRSLFFFISLLSVLPTSYLPEGGDATKCWYIYLIRFKYFNSHQKLSNKMLLYTVYLYP